MLSLRDKSAKKFADSFRFYKEGLIDDNVHETLLGVVTKVRRYGDHSDSLGQKNS